MRQLFLHKGDLVVEDAPAPAKNPNHLLVQVTRSLISTGTELSQLKGASSSNLKKAIEKPQAFKKIVDSVKLNGIKKTLAIIHSRLEEWHPMGYSSCGVILGVGDNVKGFQAGDRVACGGSGFANHAEIISVPHQLAVKIPPDIGDDSAAFITVGAIALQGVRRAGISLGETVGVIGLGLIGQLTVQLLHAAGCRVIGFDLDSTRVDLALSHGLQLGAHSEENFLKKINLASDGNGVDATLITASSPDSAPARLALEVTRRKGRVVVVGAVGMDIPRSPFYEKEQDFLISCSYGPGRYDPFYEEQGHDYPLSYVRWTENRNMKAFAQLLEKKSVETGYLVGKEYPLEEAETAYQVLDSRKSPRPLTVLLTYPALPTKWQKSSSTVKRTMPTRSEGKIRMGLIGVGEFMKSVHIPNLIQLSGQIDVVGVCAASSASAVSVGKQFNASLMTTDVRELFSDPRIDAVFIATRHDKHADMVEEALRSGKHVYVEKPLALQMRELDRLDKLMQGLTSTPVLMVGFNRRFAPIAQKLQKYISRRSAPIMAHYRVNAQELPLNHWAKSDEGGGRLRGEACHMIDYFQFLIRSPLKSCSIEPIHPYQNAHLRPDENFSAQFLYEDGSVANLIYTTLGHPDMPKERLEIHWGHMSAVLDDFKKLTFYGIDGDNVSTGQDKGHLQSLQQFVQAIRSGRSFPISWENLRETTQATIVLDQDVWGRFSHH